jgi:hypothetical protein
MINEETRYWTAGWVITNFSKERSALKMSVSSSSIREPDPAWPWRWRHYDCSKRGQHTRRYIVTSQTACIFINTSVWISNIETIIYLVIWYSLYFYSSAVGGEQTVHRHWHVNSAATRRNEAIIYNGAVSRRPARRRFNNRHYVTTAHEHDADQQRYPLTNFQTPAPVP